MKRLFGIEYWLKRLYRHGPHFHYYSSQLNHSSRFNHAQIAEYHNKHLQRMVHHCYQHVPYYKDLFRKLNLSPEDIQTRQDLVKIPFLDKQTVRENYDKLIAGNKRNFLCNIATTSGSTGTPAKFLRDYQSINFEHAAVWRQWQKAGDNGKKRLSLRGDVIVPASQNKPPFWQYNPANKELMMSSYHLSIDNSKIYIKKILEFQPSILYCGPSMGFLLAKFFKFHKIPYQFDAIFTSSENLEPDVRKYMEDTFQTRVHDWYGQAERVAAIYQCTGGSYHIVEDYSIVELMEADASNHELELVGTHLFNYVMPLLRYRTQDYIQLGSGSCACGSHFRLVDKIIGRGYNYLLTPEGYHIAITAHIPSNVDNVLETQFYQEKQGEVVLKVLTNGQFTEKDRDRLIKNTLEHTSPLMKVTVEEVSNIPRGANGKFINIINKLDSSLQSLS